MGSGGGSYIPPTSETLQQRIERAREYERQRLDTDVSALLQDFLVRVNDRDSDETRRKIREVAGVLGENVEIRHLLFGGSVAKHTYVDGLSDVDALVVLDRDESRGVSPEQVLTEFHKALSSGLAAKDVAEVLKGTLAVTVRFRDGGDVQLLPAIRSGSLVAIPDASGSGWKKTDPKRFQRKLTAQNERMNRALVPAIKLVKSLVGDLPEQQKITGYHAEALCLEAVKGYRGERTPRALLGRILDHASQRVLRPIQDVTAQSRFVDQDLGPSNSTHRRLVSQALSGIKRRLDAATSVAQWRAMFGG